jgi:signal transduction histidine kinase
VKPQSDTQVLIVEDDFMVSAMIRAKLAGLGYNVVGEATDGQQALEMVQSLRPDVVLMDIAMPNMDGIEATFQIYKSCPTPVVILTAYDTPELLKQASAAGAGAYLVKPPRSRQIERAIAIAIARFDDLMELRRLNEELDSFAHTVAHDLQNPLTFITNYAKLLKEDAKLPEAQEHFLNTIIRNAERMNNIIEELQLLAGVRKADVETHPLDMGRIVLEARKRLAYMIEQNQAEVNFPEDWPTALGYAPWVEEVWVNYLSNAIKYGGRPPQIELGATAQTNGMIRFWVDDNGPGLTPEEQGRLFIPFTRLSQTRATGYGLGLSIVRRIVERLDGQVGVESAGVPGKGSRFFFTLPAWSK